jgi:hypothetical protein
MANQIFGGNPAVLNSAGMDSQAYLIYVKKNRLKRRKQFSKSSKPLCSNGPEAFGDLPIFEIMV